MCKLKCRYCSACPHIYSCNCLDACTNTTVCKHMHLIQMQQPIINEQTNLTGNNQLEYYEKVTNVTTPMSNATTSSLRHKVERTANDILALCDRSENIAKLQEVYECLSSALECLCEEERNILQKRKPSHQKSTTQPRFYSTNKKRKIEVTGLTKPSNDQVMMSQKTLLNTEVTICGVCFRTEDTDSKQMISWICCSNCLMWVHTQCANIKSELSTDYKYICQYCSKG